MGFKLRTVNGYDFGEVASALQKSIRRNDEEVALFFAAELFNSNMDEYCWKRLMVISSEDVGLACSGISTEIWSLYQMYEFRKKDGKSRNPPSASHRMFLIHAVVMLCRAPKSRLLDWTVISTFNTHQDQVSLVSIPDYALDKHTSKGRQMGRSWEHFFTEGTVLEPYKPQEHEEQRREMCIALADMDKIGKSIAPGSNLPLFSEDNEDEQP